MKYDRILLKLSGESLQGIQKYGLSTDVLHSYAEQIKAVVRTGVQVGIVIGGGNIFRGLQGARKGFDRVKGDQMGMLATIINSLALQSALEDNGVSALFDVRRGKPSDEEVAKATTIAQVLDDLGLSAADAVMVGDRHHDVEAAAACGVPCVGVTYGGATPPGELEAAGACIVVDTVEELLRALLGRRASAAPFTAPVE